MKKIRFYIIATYCFLMVAITVQSQTSLFLPDQINYVRAGDLDVSGDQLTVEALIHYTGASVNVVSKHTDPSNVNYLLRIGSFEITTTNGFANFGGIAASGVTLDPGVTYHIAATYNGQFLRYYVNGCLTGELAWSGDMITNNIITAIGQQSSNETEQYRGYIDEVRIWNVARSQAQIANNMLDLPNPTTQTGLLLYYKFENNYTNLQGNPAWNGTPIGAPQFQQIPYPYPAEIGVTATSSPAICADTETGAIDVAGNGGYLPYEYSLDGINFQPNSNFTNVDPGNYTVYARSNVNCFSTFDITVENPEEKIVDFSSTDVICNSDDNGTAEFTVTGGNGAPYTHEWSTGNSSDLAIEDLNPGNYNLTVNDSCKLSGNELVTNGHFENGNESFTTDYTYCSNCFSGIVDLPGSNYVVENDASFHHNAFIGEGNGGSGNFMIINGSDVPNTSVWCQDIPVQPNTWYVFSTWVSSLNPGSPAELQFSVNGDPLGPVFNAPNATNVWDQFFGTWFSGAATSATICVVNQNTDPGGNDFGIDDISFKECVSCETSIDFEIEEPLVLDLSIDETNPQCGLTDGVISITASGGIEPYQFSIDNGTTFQPSGLFENLPEGEYDIVLRDENDCEVTTTIELQNEGGITLDAGEDQEICAGEEVTLTATGDPDLSWSNNVENGVPFGPSQTTTYTVSAEDEFGCTSTDDVVVIVNPLPIISGGADQDLCEGENVVLSGSGGVNYVWDNGVEDGVPFTQPPGTVVYNVVGTDQNGCVNSATVSVVVSVQPDAEFEILPSSGQAPLEVDITGEQYNEGTYAWNLGDGTTSPSMPPLIHTYVDTGSYVVTLVIDINGCTSSHSETVLVEADPVEFDVPNVFTPNNDNVNDVFQLFNISGHEQLTSFEIVIVNRWGNLINSFDDIFFVWDGTTSNGQESTEGVYFYKIIGETTQREEIVKNGFVHLVRE